jgi:16S rRNA (uracil1498-N3)-methyltransferase
VLRLQPGSPVVLFDGHGGQWNAEISLMGRQSASAHLLSHEVVERELAWGVTLAVCMPANDRMDDLVEKAAELGVARIVPLMSERSVLRLQGERATKKQAHWQGVAVAACEQSGRNRVPVVEPVQALGAFMLADGGMAAGNQHGLVKWQLSLEAHAVSLAQAFMSLQDVVGKQAQGRSQGPGNARAPEATQTLTVLSGPEGGLSPQEQTFALQAGYQPVSLGLRTLRADTAPLAALAAVGVLLAI